MVAIQENFPTVRSKHLCIACAAVTVASLVYGRVYATDLTHPSMWTPLIAKVATTAAFLTAVDETYVYLANKGKSIKKPLIAADVVSITALLATTLFSKKGSISPMSFDRQAIEIIGLSFAIAAEINIVFFIIAEAKKIAALKRAAKAAEEGAEKSAVEAQKSEERARSLVEESKKVLEKATSRAESS